MTPRQAKLWAIVVSERPMIVGRVRQRVFAQSVDDTVQSVLEKAARLIMHDRLVIAEGHDARSIVRAWLHQILMRTCTETRRTEVVALRNRNAMPAPEDLVFDPVPILEAREELRQVPRGLTRREREALDAFVRCDGNQSETAAALKLPVGTVYTRIRDVRRWLRNKRNK